MCYLWKGTSTHNMDILKVSGFLSHILGNERQKHHMEHSYCRGDIPHYPCPGAQTPSNAAEAPQQYCSCKKFWIIWRIHYKL